MNLSLNSKFNLSDIPPAASLTKSRFLLYRQAPRHAWCELHTPNLWPAPTPFERHSQEQGYGVEKLAHEWLSQQSFVTHLGSSGTPGTWHWQETFSDGPASIRTDAWWEDPKSNHVHLFEIKSSTRVKREALIDLAFQVSVINASRPVASVWLVILDRDYLRSGELQNERLFKVVDVTSQVLELVPKITNEREAALSLITDNDPLHFPACQHPKSCPCPQLCHPHLPPYPVTDLTGAREVVTTLLEAGVSELQKVPLTTPLDTKQRRMVQAAKTGQPVMDLASIQRFLAQMTFPLCFLDYEAYGSALPLFDGCRPQQHLVFQYSLHVIEDPTQIPTQTKATHFEYLALGTEDPSIEVVKHLEKSLPTTGSVMVWNASFEASRNREMADGMLGQKSFLLDVNRRILDLSDVFRNGWYVDRDFHGSWSIKNVLPILVPDLSYATLPINKGDQALLAWWSVVSGQTQDPAAIEKIRRDLLEYCGLDTWAMVRVWQYLQQLST